MILIDNLKTTRNIFYFFKVNQNLTKYKYIFFCYNVNLTLLNSVIIKYNIKYYFLKKLKCIKYLNFLNQYLNNSILLFCVNDIESLTQLIPLLKNKILYCKINNNFYSLNNLDEYLNSNYNLINYLNNYFHSFIYNFEVFQNNLKNDATH